MPRLAERPDTYFTTVRGLCRACGELRPARVYFEDGAVMQRTLCPTCTTQAARIAGEVDWYLENVLAPHADHAPLSHAHPPERGCPHDCGPCTWHASPCQLPVISITNVCNLRCPICFTYNRGDQPYFMPVDEMQATVDWIIGSSGRVDLVNVTGGEPTLHPGLLDLLRCCKRPEIGRVTMNSNGLRLSEDDELCARLAELGVIVVLSLNTLDPDVSVRLHGRDLVETKQRAIERLTQAGVRVTLLLVLVRDTNETAIGDALRLMRERDNILSLTVQTMTYTGQGGGAFGPRAAIPVDEAARIVCAQSEGAFVFSDFLPRPAAHPLCYLSCFTLKSGASFLPLARIAERQRILDSMDASYLLRLEDGHEPLLREAVGRLHARGDGESLAFMRRVVETLYPPNEALTAFERQRRAEAAVRTIYVHAHMDEDTFDSSRAMMCPDLVPAEPGRLIPACTYNLFYRKKDERFYASSHA
jgi:7,8-dihydro-6-hydroxymethylpterin dimethyltransferase